MVLRCLFEVDVVSSINIDSLITEHNHGSTDNIVLTSLGLVLQRNEAAKCYLFQAAVDTDAQNKSCSYRTRHVSMIVTRKKLLGTVSVSFHDVFLPIRL